MSQPGMVSHGMPPRDNDVQRELADLRRRLNQMASRLSEVFNESQFITTNSTGTGGVNVRGVGAKTPEGELIFEAWSNTANAPHGFFQVGDPHLDEVVFGVYSKGVHIEASGSVALTGNAGTASLNLNSSGVMVEVDTGTLQLVGISTTANGANLYLDPNTLAVSRSTSSRRYKQDIADAGLDPAALLELAPRRFRSKAEVEELGDEAPEHVGFIAEEAADLGLDEFVTVDDAGPEAFSYAGYVVGLQAIVRHQAQQIADLTARLERLEQPEPHEEG